MVKKICLWGVAHIPGANIKEFLLTILDGLVKSHSASLGSNP